MPHPPQEFYKKMAVDDLKRKKLGRKGERKAASYFKKNGWKIVKKNYRNPFGEIDIIAKNKDVVAFIEVKTRESDIFGTPSEAVTNDRKRRYILGAKHFFMGCRTNFVIRFDIIEVYQGNINHIENAFYEG